MQAATPNPIPVPAGATAICSAAAHIGRHGVAFPPSSPRQQQRRRNIHAPKPTSAKRLEHSTQRAVAIASAPASFQVAGTLWALAPATFGGRAGAIASHACGTAGCGAERPTRGKQRLTSRYGGAQVGLDGRVALL